METIIKVIETQGLNLFGGIVTLIVGFFLARLILKFFDKSAFLSKVEPTLRGFLEHLIKAILYVIVILTAVSVMGIPLTSIITILASAGVAISLAMQGALGNFVGGMTILLVKPFVAGDYIKISDTEGTVKSIGVFYTELATPDNRHIFLPNSSLTNTAIVNFTREGVRRLDVNFGVSYDAGIDHTIATLQSAVKETDGILDDPAPLIKLTECADSSLIFMIRVWCESDNYWNVNWDLLENGKRALDREGIEIPYPQLDVHMK